MIPPPRRSALGYLLLVFLSGVLVGGFAYRLYSVKAVASSTERPRLSPQEYRSKAIQEMTRRLELAPDQVRNVERIMDETRRRFQEARERFGPEVKAIEVDQHQRIQDALNETQRTEYEKMLAERERHRRSGKNPGK